MLAKALTAVLRCFHGLGHAAPNSTKTKQDEQEEPMPETIIRSHGTRPFCSDCCPTHRMCGTRKGGFPATGCR